MELFTKLGQEWEKMKRDMEELKKENQVLAKKVSGMSKDHDKTVKDMKKESLQLRQENLQLLVKVDSMEEDLIGTKQKLRSEMNKSKGFRRMVASLKRVWNRALVSAHHPSPQMPALPTPPTPSSDGNATTLTSSTASVRSSPPGACAPTPSVKHPLKAKQLTKKERKHLKDTSKFDVRMSGRPIQPGQRIKVDVYDVVHVDSVYMNVGSGVYRTPLNGRYRFGGWVWVWGKGGDVDVYVCGGDGRREKVTNHGVGGIGRVGYYHNVVWDCPEGLTVWVEVEECTGCWDTEFKVWFEGGLVD